MELSFGSRLKHAWNAFLNRDPPRVYGGGYSYRPDRPRLNRTTDRTILTAIYARMAQDATAITMADKFTRNEIMTSNEFRQVIGMKPSKDPKADQLLNKNLSPNAG